jgi:predicted glutamine amidotransferase
MCRFVAYIGKKPILLNRILATPSNSLIQQSLHAQKIHQPVNADGFGVGWYSPEVDDKPGLFKSILPAWNDFNLQHLSAKVRSSCFLGHVRRATEGGLAITNTHPFFYDNLLFCQNGEIDHFAEIQRSLQNKLDDDLYRNVHGKTDSEHFFSLMLQHQKYSKLSFIERTLEAFTLAQEEIRTLQHEKKQKSGALLNTLVTNGQELVAFRYNDGAHHKPLSLFYSRGQLNEDASSGDCLVNSNHEKADTVIIASEPLNNDSDNWTKVSANHAISIDTTLTLKVHAL